MTEPSNLAPAVAPTTVALAVDAKEFANILRHLASRIERDDWLRECVVQWDGEKVYLRQVFEDRSKTEG